MGGGVNGAPRQRVKMPPAVGRPAGRPSRGVLGYSLPGNRTTLPL
jgi:hypothetical protein